MTGSRPATEAGRLSRLSARALERPLVASLAVLVVLSLLFLSLPAVDLAVASMFTGPNGGFPGAQDPILKALRFLGLAQTRIVVALILLGFVGKLIAPRQVAWISSRALLFLAATLAVGPGLLVNAFLKEYWGRPRPIEIEVFGGADAFMRAWVPGGTCASNCSFVSGEASSSFWMLAVALVVPRIWRVEAIVAALMWALIISVNRMIFGGHFLSDVMLAWSLDLVVIVVFHRLIIVGIGREGDPRLDALFAAWGRPIRRLLRLPD